MKIMKRKSHNLLILFLITVLILSGCGAKGYDSASGGTEAAQIVADADSGFQNNSGETKEMSAVDAEASVPEEGAGEGNSSSPEISGQDLSSRKLIKTVSLTMETRTFDTLKKQLEDSIASFGGYVEQSSYDAPGGQSYRYYYLCVRIPSEHLDDFVSKAGKLGTITNQSESVQDVTLDYVDKTAYKDSLRTEYERVMELLEQAKDLEQILALESKLSDLRYEINSYESQLRTYDNQIDYSTVNINIREVEYEKETSDTVGSRIKGGFRNSLYGVRDFFVNSFVFLVSNLPVLVLLAAAAALAVLFLKKGRKRFWKKALKDENDSREVPEKKETSEE